MSGGLFRSTKWSTRRSTKIVSRVHNYTNLHFSKFKPYTILSLHPPLIRIPAISIEFLKSKLHLDQRLMTWSDAISYLDDPAKTVSLTFSCVILLSSDANCRRNHSLKATYYRSRVIHRPKFVTWSPRIRSKILSIFLFLNSLKLSYLFDEWKCPNLW